MKRRSLRDLEAAIESSTRKAEKALAHYRCGLFHDNNGREAKAIPHYQQALSLGLQRPLQAQALAWLASSFSKTNQPKEAMKALRSSFEITQDEKLKKFLKGLKRRIRRRYGEVLL